MAQVMETKDGREVFDKINTYCKEQELLMATAYFSTAFDSSFKPWIEKMSKNIDDFAFIVGHKVSDVLEKLEKDYCLIMEWDGQNLNPINDKYKGSNKNIVIARAEGYRFPVSAMQLFYNNSVGPLFASGDQSIAEALVAITNGEEEGRDLIINARGNQGYCVNGLGKALHIMSGETKKYKPLIKGFSREFSILIPISKVAARKLISNYLSENLFVLILGYLEANGKKAFWEK